jgi:D-Tyr-tRNAtyr deacylase
MLIPQATLAGQLKKNVPQYHSQIDKDEGAVLYAKLCDEFKSQLGALDDQAVVRCGTYGNRQALEFSSTGPSTHIFDFK